MPIPGKWEAQKAFFSVLTLAVLGVVKSHWWINFWQCGGAALGENAQSEFSISK